MAAKQLNARFAGRCRCSQPVSPGDAILYEDKAVVGCPACHTDLAGQAKRNHQELRIKVTAVRFKGKDDSFAVISAELDAEQARPADMPIDIDKNDPKATVRLTAVGSIGDVQNNDVVDATGYWEQAKKHGWQFKVLHAIPVVGGSEQALRAFLARFPQVGHRRAQAILQALGGKEAVIDALKNDPQRLTIVSGITPERANAIAEKFRDMGDLKDSALFLAQLGLPEGITAKILDEWGGSSKQRLFDDPYDLMTIRGIAFKTADDIARVRLKIHPHDDRRAAAAVLHLLDEEENGFNGGHTYALLEDLVGEQWD